MSISKSTASKNLPEDSKSIPEKNEIKIHLVSDWASFALTDVYDGYRLALDTLQVPYSSFPFHNFREISSEKICYHVMHSISLIKEKGFTHIMFIGGLNIPHFMFDSLYHLKVAVIATEDPHTSYPNLEKLDHIDYYFTNERVLSRSKKYKNIHYCPVAASDQLCGKIPIEQLDKKYLSDILFIGAMYPNRTRLFESLIPTIEKHNLSFKICGHVKYMPKKSPLWKYVWNDSTFRQDTGTVPHVETVKYYNGAKIVLNLMRDVKWYAKEHSFRNPHKFTTKPESLNPRAYEIPLCGSFMLMDDSRAEAREIFSDKEIGFFSDEKSLIEQVEYYLVGPGKKLRSKMAEKAYRKVAENHTYVHRLQKILSILKGIE